MIREMDTAAARIALPDPSPMDPWFALVVALPPLLLLAVGLVPSHWANRHRIGMRRAAIGLLAFALGCAIVAAVGLAVRGPIDVEFLGADRPVPLNVGVYFDSLTAVMMLLISFIGLIIARYATRYLDGEAAQGRFVRWILFTLGAVLTLVASRNLIMFATAWILTSFGLHQLLTHYPDRPWAVWAARKKFLISRLGDVFLIAALVLTYEAFGSFDYGAVFAGAHELARNVPAPSWQLSLIGTLFVLGAMTKSAQVPFHSWLPDTMETPTPVSALMHAGVINAGGFLVIRLSPLVSQSHLALDFLALTGAFTAVVGGVVMLTQTSIKRSLAYSTIAQMGFMMLQCGLGAFSAALLHIVAHSLYKAHAFLSCGSVLEAAARMKTSHAVPFDGHRAALAWPVALLLALALGMLTLSISGIDITTKPGGLVLGSILVLALTHLVLQALLSGSWPVILRGLAAAAAVPTLYLGGWYAMDHVLAASVSQQLVSPSAPQSLQVGLVLLGFGSVSALHMATHFAARRPSLRSLYVHASHGFYLDIPARRLTAWVWRANAPTP